MIPIAGHPCAPACAPRAAPGRPGGEHPSLLGSLWAAGPGALACLAGCSLVLAVVLLAATWVGKGLFEALVSPPGWRRFAVLLAAAAGLVAAQAALRIAQAVATRALGHRLAAALQDETLHELLRYRYAFFVARRSAEIGHALEDDCPVMAERTARAAAGLAEALQPVVWMVWFLRVIPWMDALVLATLAGTGAWALAWRGRIARSDAALGHHYTGLWHVVVQAVLGVKSVKLDLLRDRFAGLLRAAAERLHAEFVKNFLANAALWEALSVVPWLLLGAVLSLGVPGLQRGALTLAEVVLALLFLERLMGPVASLMEANLAVPGFQAARRSRSSLLTGDFERSGTRLLDGLERSLELRDVRFTHPGSGFQAPRGSPEFQRGRHTAIVGRTGCGKSTLLALCTRLLDAEAGAVLLDGVAVDELAITSLRQAVVAVHQDSRIFRGTLRSNLDLRGRLADDALGALLERAGLEHLLRRGNGLDAPVSDGGVELSGGERQRIAVLRALALSPSVLLLDEPTSALDAPTARRMCQLLYPPDRSATTVTITHSPLVLEYMDRVYRVADGRIEEA